MDAHDIGRGRGGVVSALRTLAEAGVRLVGVGIEGDILYGPRQVHALVDAARSAGVDTSYHEIASDKGHDAFLVEWDQLTAILGGVLERGESRVAASA
jgi:homoserine O-acetyltransferase